MIRKNIFIKFATVAFLFFIFFLIFSLHSADYEKEKISRISFEGTYNVKKELLRSTIVVKVNDPFLKSKISESVKELYKLGLFSDIYVDVKKESNFSGVHLIFILNEYPVVKTIQYEGMNKISSSDIEESVKKILVENEPYTPKKAREVAELIRAKYREEGYLSPSILMQEKKDDKTKSVTVLIKVNEGARTIVRKINIHGNKAFSEKKLLSRMSIKAKDWLHSGSFDPLKYEEDLEKLLDFYKDNGYIYANILKSTIVTNVIVKEKKKNRIESQELEISITVEEKDQYVFDGYYTIEGFSLFSLEEINKLLKLKKGIIFNQSQFVQDIIAIQQKYAGRGYIFCQVIPEEKVNQTNKTIGFNIRIFEGEIAHIESIIIKGNEKTKEYVIRRELSISEGDIFDADKIRRSREKIMNLGFFKNVLIDTRPGSAEGLMILVIDVEEQPTGMITMGATFSGSGKTFRPGGYEEISEINFLGRGFKLRERASINPNQIELLGEFATPWIFNTPTSANFQLYYNYNKLAWSNRESTDTNYIYKKRETGFVVGLGRRLSDYMRINASYNFHYYEHYDLGSVVLERAQSEVTPGGFFRNLIQLSFEYDSRDNIFDATRGMYFREGFETSYGFKKNDIYNKYTTDLSFYYKTFWKFVLVLHGYMGVIGNSFFSLDFIHVKDSDKFYLGSVDTIRGYQNAGDSAPWKLTTGKVINYYNIEYRFPIAEQILGGVIFLDGGSLWNSIEDFKYDKRLFGFSLGVGLRVQIPMMPIRFYFSWPFRYDDEKYWHFEGNNFFKSMKFDFSVGGVF